MHACMYQTVKATDHLFVHYMVTANMSSEIQYKAMMRRQAQKVQTARMMAQFQEWEKEEKATKHAAKQEKRQRDYDAILMNRMLNRGHRGTLEIYGTPQQTAAAQVAAAQKIVAYRNRRMTHAQLHADLSFGGRGKAKTKAKPKAKAKAKTNVRRKTKT